MKKVVFITGSSSGIGLETALRFYKEGWQVVATMRNPDKRDTPLHKLENIDLLHVDVCDEDSGKAAVDVTISKYGHIDVLVNNAGYELMGALENLEMDAIRKQFDTNVIGLIAMSKLVIPYMRQEKKGTIINIASIGGQITFPIMSMYHGTKHAVEGISKSMAYELKDQGIKVRIIQPGLIKTNFYSTSMKFGEMADSNPYKLLTERTVKRSLDLGSVGSHPSEVADTIYKSAVSKRNKLYYVRGKYGRSLLFFNKWFPGLFRVAAYRTMAK